MLIERLLLNKDKLAKLRDAVIVLSGIDLFGALLDNLTFNKSLEAKTAGGNTFEQSALRSAYIDGYTEALRDIYHFEERFLKNARSDQPRADFGALKGMLDRGDITKEEYDEYSTDKHSIG